MDSEARIKELEARVEALETLVKRGLDMVANNPSIRKALGMFGIKLP